MGDGIQHPVTRADRHNAAYRLGMFRCACQVLLFDKIGPPYKGAALKLCYPGGGRGRRAILSLALNCAT